LGRRGTRKDEGKAWSAEAILEESDSQYLIKYEPVEEGAQCEIPWQPKHYANAALVAWWEERKMEMALGNGNAERDDFLDLPSEDDEASEHYNPVKNHGRPEKFVTSLLSQEQHDEKSEDTKQHTVKLVDKRTFQGNEEPAENILQDAPTTVISQFPNVLMPPINVAVARMYDHRKSREPHDSAPLSSNNSGRVSASPHIEDSAILSAAVEGVYHCDKSQAHNDMTPEEGYSKSKPRSLKAAASTGQHIETLARSQQSRMNSGEHPVYALVADDTKELESSFVEAATACIPQNRNDNTSVQAAYGVQINDHSRAKDSEEVPGRHAMHWGGQGRSFPRPGTKISTLLSPVPPTPSDANKDNESSVNTEKTMGRVLGKTLAHVEIFNTRNSGVSGAPLGKLASARKQLQLLARGPGRSRY